MVEQLNLGRDFIESESERLLLAKLNLQAAVKSRQASAWEMALEYAQIAASLLPGTTWASHYSLSYAIHYACIEGEFLASNYNEAQQLAEALLKKAQSSLEKANICYLLTNQSLKAESQGYGIKKPGLLKDLM